MGRLRATALSRKGIQAPVSHKQEHNKTYSNNMKLSLFSFLTRLVLLTSLLAVAGVIEAQKSRPTPTPMGSEQDDQSEKILIRRVRLPITVVDKKGQFVPGLTKDDFVILEDRVPQQIETFSDDVGKDLPVYVAVLMDTSPSTAGKLKFEQ